MEEQTKEQKPSLREELYDWLQSIVFVIVLCVLVFVFVCRIVTVDGVRADLSPKDYDLLFYMVNNRNIALTREMLITNVWGYDFYGDDRTLDTHIKLLRRSLGPYSKFIVTLRGVGYRFETHGA